MKKYLIASVAALAASSPALAKSDLSVSLSTTMSGYSYEDDDGESDSSTFVIPITLGAEYEINKLNAIYASWRVIDEDIDGTGSGDMGVSIEGHQIEISWFRQVRLSRKFKPALGLGLRTSVIEASNKYTVDRDGFLLETFDDTDETYLSAVLSFNKDWEISRDGWYVDTRFTYDIPFGDGVQGYSLSAGIKYEF